MKTFECDNQDFEIKMLLDRKPVKLNKVIGYKIILSFPSDQMATLEYKNNPFFSWPNLTGWMTQLTPAAKNGNVLPRCSFFPLKQTKNDNTNHTIIKNTTKFLFSG